MTKDQIPTVETMAMTSNQVVAQRLLAQGLPAQPLDMLILFMQFLANEVVNRLAQGASLEDCSVLMDDFARYEILRNRAVNTSVREAKARQKAAAKTPQEVAEPPISTATAETPPPPVPANPPPPPAIAERIVHLSRQQRRALLRKQMQLAEPTADARNAS